MASSNTCWGVELGSGAIKALKVENDGGEFKVLDFAVVPHQRVLSTPDLDKNDAMRVALGTLVSRYDLTGERLVVSVPGHQSFARFATLPPVEPKKVPDIVKFEAVQQIPFALEEVEWDYQTFVSPDSPDIEVGIFAVTRQKIMEQINMLADVGLTPDIATLSPVAAYNAVASDLSFTEDTPGTIVLDIGTVSSDLIIAEAGRVWVRTFPIGGHQFTEALVSAFKISYSKAEKLKRESEQSKHARHALQAMRPVFSDIAQEIQRSIGFYQSVHADADLQRLIGLGSTFKLPGLRKYLKQQLGLDVYRLEQFKKLSLEGSRAGEFQAATLNMATAYGCALQSLESAPLRCNLMPVPVLKETMWKSKVPYLAVGAGLAAAAAGAMFIRPLLDSTAFQGAERPGVIASVKNEARALVQQAEEAAVTSDARGDQSAARIVDLVTDRELYARLLVDTSNLVKLVSERVETAAQDDSYLAQQVGDRAPIELTALETKYLPGGRGGGAASDFSGAASSRGGGRGSGRGARNEPPPTPQSGGDPRMARIESMRRVKLTATAQIPVAQNDAEGYLFDLVEPVLINALPKTRRDYALIAEQGAFWTIGATQGATSGSRTVSRSDTRSRITMPTRSRSSSGSGNLSSLAPIEPPSGAQADDLSDDPSSAQGGGLGAQSTEVTLTWFAVLDMKPDPVDEPDPDAQTDQEQQDPEG